MDEHDENMNVSIGDTEVVVSEALIVARFLLANIDFEEYAPPYNVRKIRALTDDEDTPTVHSGLWAVYLRDNTKLDTIHFRIESLRAVAKLAVPTMLRQLCDKRLAVLDDGTNYDEERDELQKIIAYIDGLPWQDNVVFEREDDGTISVLLDDRAYTIQPVKVVP